MGFLSSDLRLWFMVLDKAGNTVVRAGPSCDVITGERNRSRVNVVAMICVVPEKKKEDVGSSLGASWNSKAKITANS